MWATGKSARRQCSLPVSAREPRIVNPPLPPEASLSRTGLQSFPAFNFPSLHILFISSSLKTKTTTHLRLVSSNNTNVSSSGKCGTCSQLYASARGGWTQEP